MQSGRGSLFVVSGPSGAGKGTICKEVIRDNHFGLSVSATTRLPREGAVFCGNLVANDRIFYFI